MTSVKNVFIDMDARMAVENHREIVQKHFRAKRSSLAETKRGLDALYRLGIKPKSAR